LTVLEPDQHTLAAETVAGKRTPGGSVGEICDRTTASTRLDRQHKDATKPFWLSGFTKV
jgi:hypothetical protein